MKIWLDGKWIRNAQTNIPLLSHGLHYGSGAFEGVRAYETVAGPAIFRLGEHINRFYRSAAAIGAKVPYRKSALSQVARDIVIKNKLKSCYVRPIVFYGEGQMALYPRGAAIHVAMAAWPWPAYLGEHKLVSACISPYIRFHPRSIASDVKLSGLYATSVMATNDARARGYGECIMLDYQGNLAEGPGENIFIVQRGKLITPNSGSILRGITRASVMQIARDLDIPVIERAITPRELFAADEAFFTGTATEIAPIGKIDGKKIGVSGNGPITEKIRTTYLAAVHGELPQYRKWLTPVEK